MKSRRDSLELTRDGVRRSADWLVSHKVHQLIKAFGVDRCGEPLFFPNADAWREGSNWLQVSPSQLGLAAQPHATGELPNPHMRHESFPQPIAERSDTVFTRLPLA